MSPNRTSSRAFAPPWPLGSYLIALVLAAAAPLIALSAWVAWAESARQRELAEQGLLRTAEALSLAVDREVGILRAKLQTLGQSELLHQGDLAGFYREAARVAEDRPGTWIVLFDRSGQQLINTRLPFGAALPNTLEESKPAVASPDALPTGSGRTVREVLATGKPSNSDLFKGIVAQTPTITVDVPISRDGRVLYALNIGLPAKEFTALLREVRTFEGGVAGVVDRNGFILGRFENAADLVGRKASPSLLAELARGENAGVGIDVTHEGAAVYYAYVRSSLTGWTATVGLPRTALDAQVVRARTIAIGLALLAVLLSLLLAVSLARRIAAPIAALADAAAQDAWMETRPPQRFEAREVRALAAALARAARTRAAHTEERELRAVTAARQAEAEEASRAKDRFLALLGHELRNPLGALAGALAMLERVPGDRHAHDIAARQVRVLAKLVDDLLDVERIRTGKVQLQPERVDLLMLAESCAASAGAGAVPVTVEGRNVDVLADPVRLTQVVANLLDNALKYTPPGGAVHVRVGREGDDAVLEVIDNGIGIAPDMLPRVFDAYAQADDAVERSRGGLGLGLNLVKRLVMLQGGEVSVASEGPGRGARFTLRFPALAAAPVSAAPLRAAGGRPGA